MGIKSEDESDILDNDGASIEEKNLKNLERTEKKSKHDYDGMKHFSYGANLLENHSDTNSNESFDLGANTPMNKLNEEKVKKFSIVTKNFPRKIIYFSAAEIFEEIETGQPILLYNNYVIHIAGFINKHPGSSELITRNIGLNISLVMEGYIKVVGMTHRHSNLALGMLRKMIVGKMVENWQIQIPLSLETKHPFEL